MIHTFSRMWKLASYKVTGQVEQASSTTEHRHVYSNVHAHTCVHIHTHVNPEKYAYAQHMHVLVCAFFHVYRKWHCARCHAYPAVDYAAMDSRRAHAHTHKHTPTIESTYD